jgi:site-specific DNA-cytosine methylase
MGLLHHFGRLVEELKPEIVSMENVPQIMKHEVFADFLTILEKENYNVSYSIVYCPNYGIPQSRRRLVLMASKLGDIELLAPTHTRESYVTVRQAIGCLEPIRAGECSPSDSLHVASRLTDINLRRIRATPEGVDGATGLRNFWPNVTGGTRERATGQYTAGCAGMTSAHDNHPLQRVRERKIRTPGAGSGAGAQGGGDTADVPAGLRVRQSGAQFLS